MEFVVRLTESTLVVVGLGIATLGGYQLRGYEMNTFTETTTQFDVLVEAMKWLSKRTNVPLEQLSNHMLVISDVARVLERYGSVYGEPTEYDYRFPKMDWEAVYELISEIWHE